jgi:glutamine synthetase
MDRLRRLIFFTPVIATEIEFYLIGSHGRDIDVFWYEVNAVCQSAGIEVFKIEKERGLEQYEAALSPMRDVSHIINDTDHLKIILTQLAQQHNMRVDFAAKPLENEPGSGLHIHVHIEDLAGKNLYTKLDAEMSAPLSHSIGGLLARMQGDMLIFAPTEASRKRFVAGSNAPMTVSWGANNRTCAVRLPDTGSSYKHIEHRVAGADADAKAVIDAILDAIRFGMENQIPAPEQIYGDASLEMYGLPRLI